MPKHDPLADFLYETETVVSASTVAVPNLHPTITNVPYRLAIVGEAPGKDEVEQGKPFVGYSGQLLDRFLSRFSILRDACFIGNVCQHQPAGNKIATFDWDGPQIQGGLAKLREDLQRFRPNIILLLGGSALHAFRSPNYVPKKRKTKDGIAFAFPDAITEWRGSFFLSNMDAPLPGVKCIAAIHPAACLRQYEWTPLLMMDIQRAIVEASTPELTLPQREFLVNIPFEQLVRELEQLIADKSELGTDIEGFWGLLKCISFSPTAGKSVVIPFVKMNGESLWTFEEEMVLWKLMIQVLCSCKIVKVWQNGLFDRHVFQMLNIIVRGRSKDIMLKHWELYCELQKKLAVQVSLYTKQPYYKEDRESEDLETFLKYCGTDSAVTKEIDEKLDRFAFNTNGLSSRQEIEVRQNRKRHYEFNESLINSLLYMQKRGIRLDTELLKKRLVDIRQHLYKLQHQLNVCTGFGLKAVDKASLRTLVKDEMCYKRDGVTIKVGYEEAFRWADSILSNSNELTEYDLGRLSVELGVGLNIEGKHFKPYLYETLGLPVQKHPQTKQETTNFEALLNLRRMLQQDHKSCRKVDGTLAAKVLSFAIQIGELRTRSEQMESLLNSASDFNDGRTHSFYNEVGSETGRVTCGKLFKKYGYPLQTVADENDLKPVGHPLRDGMRDALAADSGCYLAKCDLKGADGWTIGANLASLGDTTMLDDLKFGLKPAHFPCYVRRHGPQSVIGKDRKTLVEMFKEIKKSDWDYFAAKQCTWGFFYHMGIDKAISHVFVVSEGAVSMSREDMVLFRDSVLRRYNGQLWWRAMEQRLKQPYPPCLISPSGHVRKFFNRPQNVIGEALAHEPQSVTTYATNSAVYRCWTDPENRYKSTPSITTFNGVAYKWAKTHLHVEPMHQVHDEFLSQFKIEKTAWAVGKIREWFDNTINIAGIPIVIPFEGAYGTDWAMSEKSKVGSI